jgi:hypothetical protein
MIELTRDGYKFGSVVSDVIIPHKRLSEPLFIARWGRGNHCLFPYSSETKV